jgi:transcriptional regulator GlxA family with amidase domain
VSKLERIFRRELQMSPSQYILARRLAAVNHDLHRSRSNGVRIAQIAMDHGFHHLGRFAGAYRAHFGELPSETIGLR